MRRSTSGTGAGPWTISEAAPACHMDPAVRQADAVAVSLAAAIARIVPALARVASALKAMEVPRIFGYARLNDYARERLSRSGRWVSDLARLDGHFRRLPALSSAVTGEDGGPPLHVSAALALGGIAADADVGDWIALARRMTLTSLRRVMRSDQRPGPDSKNHVAATSTKSSRTPEAESMAALTVDSPAPDAAEPRDDAAPDGSGGLYPSGKRASVLDQERADLDDDPAELRLRVPPLVRAAFRETLDLYRSVEGFEAPVTSFVEALVAESWSEPAATLQPAGASEGASGDPYGEAHLADLRHGAERDVVESALARAARGWKDLPAARSADGPGWAVRLARSSLARLRRLERRADEGDARALDARMRELLSLNNELELRIGEVLHEMGRMGAWMRLGFADAGHYAERRLGISRTAAEDRVWVARSIRPLPLIRMAYERGELGWEATRHIVRVLKGRAAGEGLQRAWVARGRAATVKRLADEVKALQREAALADTSAPDTMNAAVNVTLAAPEPMTDSAWHASVRREPGSTRHVMAGLGEALARQAGAQTSRDRMDEEIMRLRLPGDVARDFVQVIGERRIRLRRLVRQVPEAEPWPDPEAPGSVAVTRIFSIRGWREPLWVGLLGVLEDFVTTWDVDQGAARALERDGIARAPGRKRSRDEVFARAGYRCSAPGCTSRSDLQEHHILFRSHGGGNGLQNRDAACVFHHLRGIHQGLLACRGEAPLGLTWRLGRADLAEAFVNELRQQTGAGARTPTAPRR